MQKVNKSNLTNEFARGYDTYISDKKWSGPAVIFELVKPFINNNDSMLDLGIGTGLASFPFKNEGLKIYGIDSSEEMISICKSKEIADGLFLSDLSSDNFYFPDIEFDHIISNAFFHFIPNPEKLFFKISEKLNDGGCFCFTTLLSGIGNSENYKQTETEGISSWTNPENGLFVYKYTDEYTKTLLINNRFELISNHHFLGFQDKTEDKQVFFNVYLSHKTK